MYFEAVTFHEEKKQEGGGIGLKPPNDDFSKLVIETEVSDGNYFLF